MRRRERDSSRTRDGDWWKSGLREGKGSDESDEEARRGRLGYPIPVHEKLLIHQLAFNVEKIDGGTVNVQLDSSSTILASVSLDPCPLLPFLP